MVTPKDSSQETLYRRLAWLLVFRTIVATVLLGMTFVSGLIGDPLNPISSILYAVAIGTYVIIVALGVCLRAEISPVILSSVHLATSTLGAGIIVGATGGVDSLLSFFYLLAILDSAIVGAQTLTLAVASACSVLYGAQLVGQRYGLLGLAKDFDATEAVYVTNFIVHMIAFYLAAWLAGHLSQMVEKARREATTAQTDLHQMEELHVNVLRSLPVGVMTFDRDFHILSANPTAVIILGVDASTVIGSHLPASLIQFIAECIDESKPSSSNLIYFRDGESVQLSCNYSKIAQLHSTAMGFGVLVIEDRTDFYLLESTLREKRHLASLGELSAAIAHELRNPLAAISGATQLLASHQPDNPTYAKLQRICTKEISRLDQLVTDFLVYARPSAPERVWIDLQSVVRDVVLIVKQEQRGLGIHVETEACEGLFDAKQVHQLIWNLLRNALEASSEQGEVSVRLERSVDRATLQIDDTGSGIDPTIVGSLFEPFKTTKAGGTGLGLSIVHRITELHQGSIEFSANTPQGTRVCVSFPLVAADEPHTVVPSTDLSAQVSSDSVAS
jgi:two-component system, NtrC family, sensor histidine kinase PilS